MSSIAESDFMKVTLVLLLFLMSVNIEGCNRVTPKTMNEDSTDWKNISQFQSLSPSGPDSLWVVTVKGDLIRVSSKGEFRRVGQFGPVNVVAFKDAIRGWAVDRKSALWASSDGGDSWQLVFAPETNVFYLPQQLTFVDDLHGWLVGISKVWQTSDGGRSWQEKFSISGNIEPRMGRLYRGAFIGIDKGWLASSGGVVIQTIDGGSTWKTSTPVSERTDLHDVSFVSDRAGWLIGRPLGGIYSTSDGGNSWHSQSSPQDTYLHSIDFADEKEGWAVGLTIRNQDWVGLVLHSVNGGNDWVETSVDVKERFFDKVYFYDKAHGWLVARDAIYYTDDAGRSFRRVFTLPPIENSST